MKTKVLIWWAKNGGTAESMLNEWLSQNSQVEIVSILQSEAGDVVASRRITYTILYR